MKPPRFHVPTARAEASVLLPDDAAHHARSVLRLRPGAALRVFDGAGHEYDALVETCSRGMVRARVGTEVRPRPEPALRVVLALAPLKGDRMEWAVQKAVELGVGELRPVVTARTDAAARPTLRGSRHERWQRVAVSAAEQCGRAVVPGVAPAVELGALLAEPFEGPRLVFSPEDPATLGSLRPPLRSVLALVGPEGGFDPAELDRARAAGYLTIGLGPRILRAETAALAALAALHTLFGDLC